MFKYSTSALLIGLVLTAGCVALGEGETSARANSDDSGAMLAAAAPSMHPMVGGATMLPSKTIVDNAATSKDHTTLVGAIQAAGLVDTLRGSGPFTVFAPTNAAFDRLPAGTVETLLKPGNKSTLANVLTHHVVRGHKTAAVIKADLRASGGSVTYLTAAGDALKLRMDGDTVVIMDGKGRSSRVTQADIMQSNGVVHVVDTVLLPFGVGSA